MQWKNIQRDFVERTLQILSDYEKYLRDNKIDKSDPRALDTTLLVNCLTGILVIPMGLASGEAHKERIQVCNDDHEPLSKFLREWGIEVQIDNIQNFDENHTMIEPSKASLRVFAWRMRNSVAHARFMDAGKKSQGKGGIGLRVQVSDYGGNPDIIENLVFTDAWWNKKEAKWKNNFKATISVQHLKTFAQCFGRALLAYQPKGSADSLLGA